jgi:hypothetical protein
MMAQRRQEIVKRLILFHVQLAQARIGRAAGPFLRRGEKTGSEDAFDGGTRYRRANFHRNPPREGS